MIQQQLGEEDRLYRWGGPVLVALLHRPSGVEQVRSELSRALETAMQHTIQTPTRSIMIPITARWCLFPMTATARITAKRIDDFIARQPARG
jgi:hypothetical protein